MDGVVSGYPADYTREWSTYGGRAGSWIDLRWLTVESVDRVVLFDRPNLADNITTGQLVFSDGSTVSVGPLNSTGGATTVTFPARSVTGVRFTITGVSANTINVGLAEFQVWTRGS